MLDWWRNSTLYEVYVPSFYDSDSNGLGDLKGVTLKLEYLASVLGIDALLLTPFYPSPKLDMGYDISNFTSVDPAFGNLEDFDILLEKAHLRGLKVLIDFVPNHTSNEHPWFKESRSSKYSTKRNWYYWANPRSGNTPPNNWISVFGGSAWEWDASTGQYYLHSHLIEQPDLNWRNPAVKDAMFETIRFWVERGIDGLRIDSAERLIKDPEFRDNPPNLCYTGRPDEFMSQLHVHDKGHADVHNLYRELRALLDSIRPSGPLFSVGEVHASELDSWRSYFGGFHDELHSVYSFALVTSPWEAQSVKEAIDALEMNISYNDLATFCLGNHDVSRVASRVGVAQARVAAMLLLTLRGIPQMYYGDELGMTDVEIVSESRRDRAEKRSPGSGRDHCRTPMQWNGSSNAGFSSVGNPSLWLPVSSDYKTVNVEKEIDEPRSILNLYRALIKYRKNSLVLTNGEYQAVDCDSPDCYLFLRILESNGLLIALNFSHHQQRVSLGGFGTGKGKRILSTYLDGATEVELKDIKLRADEGIIVELM